MSNNSSEHGEQVFIFQWAKLNSGRWPELSFMFAIPNGAKLPFRRNKKGQRYSPQAMKLKAEGLLPGASDIMLPCARGGYHGLFIELKYDKNTLSDDQEVFLEGVNAQGYLGVACWGGDEAIKMIEDYLEGRMIR